MGLHELLKQRYEEIVNSETPFEDDIVRINGRDEKGRVCIWAVKGHRRALAVSRVVYSDTITRATLGIYELDKPEEGAVLTNGPLSQHRRLVKEGVSDGIPMDELSAGRLLLTNLVDPVTIDPVLPKAA